ncbi:MAG: hypothetical protein RLY58_556 [Pseudomonadota bacterium]|jgi:acetyl esterase/lipase
MASAWVTRWGNVPILGVAVATSVALLTGCSSTQLLSALTPQRGVTQHSNVPYGSQPRQSLDIYQPQIPAHVRMRPPVVVFVHGGSWDSGDKSGYAFMGKRLAQAGYTTVIMNYRLAPTHRYPDFVQDTADAIGWTYRNIARYGGDPEQLFVMGHSAGAFNAITAVDDARFWSTTGVPDHAIVGVIGLAGPYAYDFTTDPTKTAFPAQAKPDDIMPDRHVRPNPPPHLLVMGEKDTVVGEFNARHLQAALQRAGGSVELTTVKRVSHTTMIAAFATPTQFLGQTPQVVLEYMQRHQVR